MVPTAVLTLGILQRHRGRSDPIIDVGNPFVVYCCHKRGDADLVNVLHTLRVCVFVFVLLRGVLASNSK